MRDAPGASRSLESGHSVMHLTETNALSGVGGAGRSPPLRPRGRNQDPVTWSSGPPGADSGDAWCGTNVGWWGGGPFIFVVVRDGPHPLNPVLT